jgi:hypothetical protein
VHGRPSLESPHSNPPLHEAYVNFITVLKIWEPVVLKSYIFKWNILKWIIAHQKQNYYCKGNVLSDSSDLFVWLCSVVSTTLPHNTCGKFAWWEMNGKL